MNALPSLDAWWNEAELQATAPAPTHAVADAGLAALAQAYAAELALDIQRAASLLTQAGQLLEDSSDAVQWHRVRRLLELRVAARGARGGELPEVLRRVEGFAWEVPSDERATLARADHLIGTLQIRLGQFELAEGALSRALERVNESPSKLWILDGFGQVLLGQGVWQEARRIFSGEMRIKGEAGDLVGLAITAGHLAMLELRLGFPEAAEAALRVTLERCGERIAERSRLRLQTYLVQACLDQSGAGLRAAKEAEALENLLAAVERSAPGSHHLNGFACLALARASAGRGDAGQVSEWLKKAQGHFELPGDLALVRYWEGRLLPERAGDEWLQSMQALFGKADIVTEAQVLTHLLLAERGAGHADAEQMQKHLDLALDSAESANSPLLVEQVDLAYARLSPHAHGDRVVERYSGRPAEGLRHSASEDATIVFADLVGFTARSTEMSAREVMATCRSLFELSVPLQRKYHVRPLTYLGDGLLAIAQGEGHAERGLAFARDLVRQANRLTLVRKALGERWGVTMRAGVAAGPVVLGALGSQFRLQYTAIGMTVNLASRLETAAEPSQVICEYQTAGREGALGTDEQVTLKGIARPVRVVRFAVGT